MTRESNEIKGVVVFKSHRKKDDRGYLLKTFEKNAQPFSKAFNNIKQVIVSETKTKFTLRGLHFQNKPKEEAKLVTCLSGSLFGVVVDLRVGSSTFGRWLSYHLGGDGLDSIFVPKGVAHGYLTLSENVQLIYHIDQSYDPLLQSGILWNDPYLGILWPHKAPKVSEKDANLKPFKVVAGNKV